MKEFIVEYDDNLKNFTDNTYAQGSFWFRTLLKNKDIRVNGKKTDRNIPVKKGDLISYYLTQKQEERPAFYEVYADENILVIDKESGVNSEAVYAALKTRGAKFVHRLDRNTQGLMVFAMNEQAETELLRAFKERKVEKKYLAVVCGRMEKDGEILTAYLKKDAEQSEVKIYDSPLAGAEKIVTQYTTQARTESFSRVEITLHTGKTHQIRAHFAYIGHPLVGDTKYGSDEVNKKFCISRQSLVAKKLSVSAEGMLSYLKDNVFESRFEVEFPKEKVR